MLFAGVSSLHHLLFTPETYYDFSSQLLKATGKSRKFNGVVHMFIVTFGRLSWAEAPEWLPPEGRSLCESLSGRSLPYSRHYHIEKMKSFPWNWSRLSCQEVLSMTVYVLSGMSQTRWKIKTFLIIRGYMLYYFHLYVRHECIR